MCVCFLQVSCSAHTSNVGIKQKSGGQAHSLQLESQKRAIKFKTVLLHMHTRKFDDLYVKIDQKWSGWLLQSLLFS